MHVLGDVFRRHGFASALACSSFETALEYVKNGIIFGDRICFMAWTIHLLFSLASLLTSIWLSFTLWKVSFGASIKLSEQFKQS